MDEDLEPSSESPTSKPLDVLVLLTFRDSVPNVSIPVVTPEVSLETLPNSGVDREEALVVSEEMLLLLLGGSERCIEPWMAAAPILKAAPIKLDLLELDPCESLFSKRLLAGFETPEGGLLTELLPAINEGGVLNLEKKASIKEPWPTPPARVSSLKASSGSTAR